MRYISDVATTDEVDEFLVSLLPSIRHSLHFLLEEVKGGQRLDRLVELPDTDGVWEVRVEEGGSVHYIFGFWAPDGNAKKLMLCAGGSYPVCGAGSIPRALFGNINKVELIKRNYFQNGSA